ncbi:MAG: hypothetical protein M0D55_18305 [Elusimicrobiota bacterium]|nr:MAG: hypothetical protein M0D55_18305 [Elusimicrobiota bacterium]
MRQLILLGLLAAAAPALAASPVRLTGGAKAEDKLRRFIEQDAALKARLDEAARREEAYVAEARESDLRDAVSDFSGESLRSALEKTSAEKRKDLVSGLPGMASAPKLSAPCRSVDDCANPELALDVADSRALAESVRRLVRPWMVLQQARGSEAVVSAVDGPGDAAIAVKLKDLDAQPLILNVSPRLLGGFKVWFERPLVLAALYGREREAVLRSSR